MDLVYKLDWEIARKRTEEVCRGHGSVNKDPAEASVAAFLQRWARDPDIPFTWETG